MELPEKSSTMIKLPSQEEIQTDDMLKSGTNDDPKDHQSYNNFQSSFMKMDFFAPSSTNKMQIGTYFENFDVALQAVKDFQVETRRRLKFVHNDTNRRIDARCSSKSCEYRLKIRKASDRRRKGATEEEKGFVVAFSGPDHTCEENDNVPGMDKMREISKRIAQDWDLNEYISLKQIIQKEKEVRGVTISKIKASRALRLARIQAGFAVPPISKRRKRKKHFDDQTTTLSSGRIVSVKRQNKRREDIHLLAAVNASPAMITAYLNKKYPKELWQEQEVEAILFEKDDHRVQCDLDWDDSKFGLHLKESKNYMNGHEIHSVPSKPNVLLALTGSVATVKGPQIALLLSEFSNVRILLTQMSRHFWDTCSDYDMESWEQLKNMDTPIDIFEDKDEWGQWKVVGDKVMHIKLRAWADCMVIAPLSANTLAKLANGVSDNLVTCVARAWDFSKPLILCPAMNTMMWDHPLTSPQLQTLATMGCHIIEPVSKTLACGDTGKGALAKPVDIAQIVKQKLVEQGEAASAYTAKNIPAVHPNTSLTHQQQSCPDPQQHHQSPFHPPQTSPLPNLATEIGKVTNDSLTFMRDNYLGFPHSSFTSHYIMGGIREEV